MAVGIHFRHTSGRYTYFKLPLNGDVTELYKLNKRRHRIMCDRNLGRLSVHIINTSAEQ
jgi:hypothetical protein